MFCLTLYFQKDVTEYTVLLHCIIVSLWNLKSLSFAFIRCTTCCHSLYHSLYYSLSLVAIRCTTCFHSLSIVFIRCHSLYHLLSLVVPLVVTRCHLMYHLPVFLETILTNMCSDLLINKMMCSWRGLDDTCSENFVIFTEKYPWWSLMLMKLQYVESQLFRTTCSAKYIS